MDEDSLACACWILGLFDPEQKEDNLEILLKFILRQLNSEDVKGSDNGGWSCYTKLHDHLEWIHWKGKYKKIGKKQRNLVAVSYKLL